MGRVFIFVGRSASGKTSLQNYLSEKLNYPVHVSYTTRGRREKEIDGVDYHFVSRDVFESTKMLERVEFNGNLYGIPKSDFEQILFNNKVSFIVTEQSGARLLKKLYGNCVVTILLDMPAEVSRELLCRRDGCERGNARFASDNLLDWGYNGYDHVVKETGKNWKTVRKSVLKIIGSYS